MSVETELRMRLLADSTVGGLISARMYPQHLPQNPTYPAITYQKITGLYLQDLDGAGTRGRITLQVNCWAADPAAAQALADAVRSDIDGFIGLLTTLKVSIRMTNEFPGFEETTERFEVIQEYVINHS
jgi:hypothetical protein